MDKHCRVVVPGEFDMSGSTRKERDSTREREGVGKQDGKLRGLVGCRKLGSSSSMLEGVCALH